MSLNVDAIRSEFTRLELTNGKIRLDRIPTREDIHARWHWGMIKFYEDTGRDPAERKLGRHSFLIGGVGNPDIKLGEPPLEWRFRYDPMPLAWFDHPGAHAILSPIDPDHVFLHHLASKHLAGLSNRPKGKDIYRMFITGQYNDSDKHMMGEMLSKSFPEDYPRFYRCDALSIWHIARAVHDCQVLRGRLSWWLNTHAVKPEESTR